MAETIVTFSIAIDTETLLRALLAALEDAKKPMITLNIGPISEQKERK